VAGRSCEPYSQSVDIDAFTERHRAEWKHLDDACAGGSRGLARRGGEEIDEIVRLYLRVSGHLAEAQTRYHDPSLEDYLTSVVTRAHGAIYGSEPRSLRSLLEVFGSRYREEVRRTLPYVLAAGAVLLGFAIATGIWIGTSRTARAGVVPGLIRGFVRDSGGEGAIRFPAASLSAQIFLNNARVAILAFVTGIALGIPTMFMIVQNAVLLGALAGATTAAGASGRFWSLVLPHGLLELTAICIAGGAGLRMGWSLIDPRDRPRGVAVADEARGAVIVALGVIPAFVIAALIEGFFTPSGIPGGIKIGVGGLVEAAYLAFLVLPSIYRRPAAFSRR